MLIWPKLPILNCALVLLALLSTAGEASAQPSVRQPVSPEEQKQLDEAARLGRDIQQLRTQRKYREAIDLTSRQLEIRKRILGEEHADTAVSAYNLGVLQQTVSDFAAAQESFERALRIRKSVLGEDDAATARAAGSLAFVLYKRNDYAAALPLLEQALKTEEKVVGEDHRDTAATLNYLGLVHIAKKDYAAARPCLEKALAIRQKVLGEEDPYTVESLNNLASLSQTERRYEAAQQSYEQALRIRRKVLGDEHPDVATSLTNLANVLAAQLKYADAQTNFEQALSIRRKVFGAEHANTASSLASLGTVLTDQSQYAAARPYLEQALAIRQKLLGDENAITASSLTALGRLLKDQGEYAAAKPYFEQALAIRRNKFGNESSTTASSLTDLASVLRNLGDYKAAKPYYEQALEIKRKVLGEQDADTATAHGNLGVVLSELGDLPPARTHYEQALAIDLKVLGENHPKTATSYGNLGSLLAKQGDLASAQAYAERALSIRRKVLGEDHADTAAALNSLANILERRRNYASARTYFEQSIEIKRKTLGENHPGIAPALTGLGSLVQREGDLAGAKKYFEQALEIRSRALGERHPQTAVSLNILGQLLKTEGDYAGARKYYEQAVQINRDLFGSEHPDTIVSLNNSVGLAAACGDWSAAAALQDESRRGARRYIAHVLPALSTKEQLAFLRDSDQSAFHRALSLGLAQASDATTAALSAAWLLNGKAVAEVALAEQALLARDMKDPALAEAAKNLVNLRHQLATLAIKMPKAGEEAAHRTLIKRLTTDEDRLARWLAHRTQRESNVEPWVDLAEVRNRLPAKSALVDIARLPVYDFQASRDQPRWQPARYVAWITRPNHEGETTIVDLGPAEAIDKAVQTARKGLEIQAILSDVILGGGEAAAEKQLRAELQSAVDLIWAPIAAKVEGVKELIISPDGLLWHLPWDAIPLGPKKYAVEEFGIRYVMSGRDLMPTATVGGDTGRPIVVANPSYDLESEQIRSALKAVFPSLKDAAIPLADVRERSVFSGASPLPLTADEARAVAPNLQRFAGAKPQMFMERYALESVIKRVKRPSVVFLSTHGFFLADEEIRRVDEAGIAGSLGLSTLLDPQVRQNPLLRCGLLFAGCNSPQAENLDDGVLTGMEILGIDLRGTKLVVLSACETGLGQVRNGEGVAGLRQAFRLAGAESVVASLWSVPVGDTADLMNDLFSNLANGQTPAESLRLAQVKRIAAHRSVFGASHPWFWAAFTVTGR